MTRPEPPNLMCNLPVHRPFIVRAPSCPNDETGLGKNPEFTMKKLIAHALAPAVLAAGLAVGLSAPVTAAPLQPLAVAAPSSNVTAVRDDDRRFRKRHRHRHWQRHHHRHNHHRHWRPRSGIYLNFGVLPRYEYRVAPRRHYRTLPSAHIRWCQDRYRSYRVRDNSWQPYNGPRRQCRSPYY